MRACIVAAAMLAAAAPCWPHGDTHAAKPSSTAHRKQQMPWGTGADGRTVRRTIEVRMTDNMRFSPDRITVRQGDTVRFVVRNHGNMLHEMVIGTKGALDEHAKMMENFPGMEHDEPYMTHVKPGKDGRIVWNFNRAGEFEFACLVPGHYRAGMVGAISVTPAGTTLNERHRNP